MRQDLWPDLLGLAALLLPFDVGVRRLALGRRDVVRAWDWVAAHLPRRRPRPVAEASSPVSRLFQDKARAEERRPVGRVSVGDAAAPPAEPEAPPPPGEGPEVSPAEPAAAMPSSAPPATGTEEGTLAGRLLRRKREREREE